VDEVPELVRQRPNIKEHLGRIAQAGRHAGLHLILAAQHPLTSELGSATMRNIGARLVGRVADRTAAYNASGRSDSGAEFLRGGGDFLYLNGQTKVHFTAAMPSPELLEQWVERYPPRPPRLPPRPSMVQTALHRIASAPPTPVDDGGNGGHGGGRGLDDIPESVIAAMLGEMQRGNEITPRVVRNWTRDKANCPTGEFNQGKAERAVSAIYQRARELHITRGG